MKHSRNFRVFKWIRFRARFGEVIWLMGRARAGT